MINSESNVNDTEFKNKIWLCNECDCVITKHKLSPGDKVYCPICSHKIAEQTLLPTYFGIIASLLGIILVFPASFLPVLDMYIFRENTSHSVISGIFEFINQGMWAPAIFISLGIIIFPILYLTFYAVILYCLQKKTYHAILPYLLRGIEFVQQWLMLEVYLLGLFVSMFKLKDLAHIQLNFGIFNFIGLMLCQIFLMFWMKPITLWEKLKTLKNTD